MLKRPIGSVLVENEDEEKKPEIQMVGINRGGILNRKDRRKLSRLKGEARTKAEKQVLANRHTRPGHGERLIAQEKQIAKMERRDRERKKKSDG
jgi:hypothetical protein